MTVNLGQGAQSTQLPNYHSIFALHLIENKCKYVKMFQVPLHLSSAVDDFSEGKVQKMKDE